MSLLILQLSATSWLKTFTFTEIHEDMIMTLGEGASSFNMVKKWAAEFRWETECLEDDPHPGRTVTISTQGPNEKIHDMVLEDQWITEHYIATHLCISQERIHAVNCNELQMTKMSVHWVPKLLWSSSQAGTSHHGQEKSGSVWSRSWEVSSAVCNHRWDWVHHFQSETKKQSKQWKHQESPPPTPRQEARRPRQCHVLVRWWPPSFGMKQEYCWWTLYEKG